MKVKANLPNETETIHYAVVSSDMGDVLVAQSEKGVCAVLIGDSEAELRSNLMTRFSTAKLVKGGGELERLAIKIVQSIAHPKMALDIKLDVRGTDFQRRVWDALRRVPGGQTATYTDIAKKLNTPKAVRAVGGACAANPLAILIPCHRILKSDGGLSGYYWGVDRKRKLLEAEGAI